MNRDNFIFSILTWLPFNYFSHLIVLARIPSTVLTQSGLLFSRSVMSDSWWPHGLQHARLPCPSPSPGPCSNTCPQSWWCHPTISSSVIPFSSCPQSFPASGSFLMSQLFRCPKYWSFSFSISPSDEYSGLISFRMDWLVLLAVQGTFYVPGSSVHGILQARILEWVAISFSRLSVNSSP